MRKAAIRTYDDNGNPALVGLGVDTDTGNIIIYQRVFREEPDPYSRVLRTWKGAYYCERVMGLKSKTFGMITDLQNLLLEASDEDYQKL